MRSQPVMFAAWECTYGLQRASTASIRGGYGQPHQGAIILSPVHPRDLVCVSHTCTPAYACQ